MDDPNVNPNAPIPLDDDPDKPIPLDDEPRPAGVSHAPLNLGGSTAKAPPPRIEIRKPVAAKPTAKTTSAPDRITGMKTFFTKLHPGAMQFLDEQVTSWLKQNPGVKIKRTNLTTGEVQAKKTEPNVIITVWY